MRFYVLSALCLFVLGCEDTPHVHSGCDGSDTQDWDLDEPIDATVVEDLLLSTEIETVADITCENLCLAVVVPPDGTEVDYLDTCDFDLDYVDGATGEVGNVVCSGVAYPPCD